MVAARRRIARAYAVTKRSLGSRARRGAAQHRALTAALRRSSAVELDYGGLVQLMADDVLIGDTSDFDVCSAVDALESGDAGVAASAYERLQAFWSDLAGSEQLG